MLDTSQKYEIRASEYTHLGLVTEFQYGTKIKQAIDSLKEVFHIKDGAPGMLPSKDALIFVDNHDNQRGHGSADNPLTFRKMKDYKKAQVSD